MDGTWTTYLLRYGELGIKGPAVRRRFEGVLIKNIQAHFARAGATCLIERAWGRLFLESPDEAVARHAIAHTFGLVSGSPVLVTEATIPAVQEVLARIAPDHIEPGRSFAVRARRTGEHSFSSVDLGREGGSAIYNAVPDLSVDLDTPDVAFHVEVRDKDAYVFTEQIAGPGGLPTGSQGKVVVPVLGVRSPSAAWLAMRRGAAAHLLVPEGGLQTVRTLSAWAPRLTATVLPGRPSRAGLVAAAVALAGRLRAHAIVLDDHETRISPVPEGFPALRPLAGLPGARWPAGARAVAKAAARDAPGWTVTEEGAGPEETLALLDAAEDVAL